MNGIIRLSTPQKDEKNDGGKGCSKPFSLCVVYRTSVLLRGVSLLKEVGNQIMHKTINHQPTYLQQCVETPGNYLSLNWSKAGRSIRRMSAGVSGRVVSIDSSRV